ncbi:hypothetical protein RRG08_020587 [Elysia crispata]|uniref:Uncharacterized protein n=1 Tax=Elysia crispata TaxID=231223 RepID=A0AAE1A777_9GAST|nr:hypothetical protein RRG08_020587 [Elysia crispata]
MEECKSCRSVLEVATYHVWMRACRKGEMEGGGVQENRLDENERLGQNDWRRGVQDGWAQGELLTSRANETVDNID